MAELDDRKPVSLELMVSTLAMTDALVKLLNREGRHHGCGVQAEVVEERAVYQRILNSTTQ